MDLSIKDLIEFQKTVEEDYKDRLKEVVRILEKEPYSVKRIVSKTESSALNFCIHVIKSKFPEVFGERTEK